MAAVSFVRLMKKILFLGLVVGALLGSLGKSSAAEAGGFYLKEGDRVVFYGDSITDQRLYTLFAETFVVTRFPSLDVTFTHSGWGGDKVSGGGGGGIDARLNRDVFAYDPTVVTIMLGMNDGRYRAFDQGIFNTYKNGLNSIVDKLEQKKPGVRITLIEPSPYDDITREPKFEGGYNAVLIRFGAAVADIAKAHQQQVADLNTSVVAMLKKARATDAKLSEKIIGDRIHPGPSGHLIMAAALLKAWNAPAVVSAVEINAAQGKILRSENTAVSDFQADKEGFSWTQLDRSLPMPVDMGNRETALAVSSSDFVDTLNQQVLKVDGATAETYSLSIDGEIIGLFTKAEMADGINLAMMDTPMRRQAQGVYELTRKRTDTHNFRWRSVQVPMAQMEEVPASGLEETLRGLDTATAVLRQMQRKMAQPQAHRYELRTVSAAQQGLAEQDMPKDLGENLASNKKWTTDAPNSHGWNVGLTDGVWTGRNPNVFATNESDRFPKTVTIDLEREERVGAVLIGVPEYGSTKTVEVSISRDGKLFERVGYYTFSLRQAEKRFFQFPAKDIRYVRLSYLNYYSDRAEFPQRFMFTSEVQVFGKGK